MKKLLVEQTGSVQVQAERKFVVEIPGDLSEEQIEQLRRRLFTNPDVEEIEWTDEDGCLWSGFDVEFVDTVVHDSDAVLGKPTMEGLKVVRLDAPADSNLEDQPDDEM